MCRAALLLPTRDGIFARMKSSKSSIAPSALHLTASMRVIKAHEGGRVSVAWAKRRVAEAAAAWTGQSAGKDLLLLAAKLERACGCSIDELATIAETWEV